VRIVVIDEHRWAPRRHGTDGFVTVIIDLTPVHDRSGPARLLDVVSGRSATALASWLSAQTADFAQTVQVIAMNGFAGCKTAAAQVIPDAVSTVLNWSEGLDSDVRSCLSSHQSRSSSINRPSLDPEVMRELVEHDVFDLAA
jgi:hypothetical protein